MKDKVFIAWSGSNSIALEVKRLLEKDYNYVCSIGGNSDNSSKFSSVGDTVIQQIKSCNQAIVIFQNRKDGAVSNNLFFELGYVMAMYGMKKVHCVKRANEDVVLPSDFDNSFVEALDDRNDATSFAQEIVAYFIGRQKMSINENKMYLINNRYLIHDKIVSHYPKPAPSAPIMSLPSTFCFICRPHTCSATRRKRSRKSRGSSNCTIMSFQASCRWPSTFACRF